MNYIVTGASQNHFLSLLQFINSFLNFYINNNDFTLIVYDLGIKEEHWNFIQQKYKDATNIIYKRFDFSMYPYYFNIEINAGEYAWKPVIIYNTCLEFGDNNIIWFDSGNIIVSKLDNLINTLRENGVYSPCSSGNIQKWTHPSTLKYMGCDYLDSMNRNGACIAFNHSIPWAKEFVKEFHNLALTKDCIAPEGSNRTNHRQDQAVFTILYYKYNKQYNFSVQNNYLGFTIHNDCDNLNNQNNHLNNAIVNHSLKSIKDITHVFYINLEERTDRKELVEKELDTIGFKSYERFNATKLPNSALGCSISHLKCIQKAKENNWDHVLIVEDDIQFLKPDVFIKQMNHFLQNHPTWDVVILSGNNCPPFINVDESCVRVSRCQTTTGYLVKSHYYDRLISNYKDGMCKLLKEPENRFTYAIDKYWFELQKTDLWFLIIPLTVVQREGYSDIENRVTNYQHLMTDLEKKHLFNPTIIQASLQMNQNNELSKMMQLSQIIQNNKNNQDIKQP